MSRTRLSLKTKIILQFAAIMLPAMLVLIYQAVSDAGRTDKLAHVFSQHTSSSDARAHYKRFLDGVIDAVDTGNVASGAFTALTSAREKLRALAALDPGTDFGYIDQSMTKMITALAADSSLRVLTPMREAVNTVATELARYDDHYERLMRASVEEATQASSQQRTVLIIITLLTVLIVRILLIRWINSLSALQSYGARLMSGDSEALHAADAPAEIRDAVHVINKTAASLRTQFGEKIHVLMNALVQHKKAMDEAAIVSEVDVSGHITYVNDLFAQTCGVSRERLIGRPLNQISNGTPGHHEWIPGSDLWRGEVTVRNENERVNWLKRTIVPIRDASDGIEKYICIDIDITGEKEAEAQLEMHATHDQLTGLPNRALLHDRAAQTIAYAERSGAGIALLFIDFDNFKYVNDGYGHAAGDALLRSAARRFESLLRKGDTVARLGGDEFVVMLPDLPRGKGDAQSAANKLLKAFRQPLRAGEYDFTVTPSIGISLFPEDGRTLDELLMKADAAMYLAKESGRNEYRFYERHMSDKAVQRVAMESALRHALDRDELELYYQPQICLKTDTVVGMEALVRWRHPQLGLVSPVKFIPVAEETGLIIPIGEWVLQTACKQTRAWHDAGMQPLKVSVNLSARQLRQTHFSAVVQRALEVSGLDPQYLDLELTESMVMGETLSIIARLNELRALGLKLSMDDFGTGYSSLAYLNSFPLEQLKIDRSFVINLPEKTEAVGIARAIVSMAGHLRLRTLAEGVETPAQAEFLANIGCEYAQGFLYSQPVPATQFETWLHERSTARTGLPGGAPPDRLALPNAHVRLSSV